jgi:N-acetyl-1-D-myo-inositol-2-amino-2-deoxy-alpha-D-glucopyranoside deacetylase
LEFPDGKVDAVPFETLVNLVGSVLEQEQPTVVFTYGPDGISGHPNHIAIGAATDEAFARVASSDGPAFRRLLHGAVPESVFRRWNAQRGDMGLLVFDPTQMYHMRGVPDEQIGVVVNHVMSDDSDDIERGNESSGANGMSSPGRHGYRGPALNDVFHGLS